MRNAYTIEIVNPHEEGLDPLGDPEDGHVLTRAIIDTIREPLIILDENLRIIAASLSFYRKFDLTHENTRDVMFYDLGNGQWNIPALRKLLEQVIPKHTNVKGYAVSHDFPTLGKRTMLINAREIRYENGRKKMLISIFDVTHQKSLEQEKEKLMRSKDLLLKEMRHRIANSLQLIASILMLKAETVDSKESRAHLEDAHDRIMSIATVQRQLEVVGKDEEIQVAAYLTGLCKSLARSMVGGRKAITVKVVASAGSLPSDTAVSVGLITTELVINALKHGFPDGQAGTVLVTYSADKSGWTLVVSDNGVGKAEKNETDRVGLGTSILEALTNQLEANIQSESSSRGTKISVTHGAV
jgi:chemotaxis protein methyltransferase CheR